MRDNEKFKARFTPQEIDKIMEEASENEQMSETSEALMKKWNKMREAFESYLSDYETRAFHWGYELGYAAAIQDIGKGGAA